MSARHQNQQTSRATNNCILRLSIGCFRCVTVLFALLLFIPAPARGSQPRFDRWRWSNPLPHGNNVMDMVVTSSLTIQVGDSGSIFVQGLDERWTPAVTGVTKYLRSVTLLGARFIAVGEEGCILWSDNGREFLNATVTGINGQWFEGVASSGQRAVAVGDEGFIYTSADGVSWAKVTSGTSQWLRSIAFGNGTFVAVGENGKILRSVNLGNSWSSVSSGTTAHLNRVRYVSTGAGSQFIAVGTGGTAIYSGTGTNNWASLNAGTTNTLFDVAANTSGILLVGDQEILYRAAGVTSWTSQISGLPTNSAPAWTYYTAVAVSDSFLVAGRAGMLVEGNTTTTHEWHAAPDSSHAWLWDATVQKGIHVAVGDLATIQTSLDGILWAREAVPGPQTNMVLLGVGGSTNLLLAVGNSGNVLVSYAGLTNVTVTNYVSGNAVTTNVLTETLGLYWQPVPPFTTNTLQGVAWNGSFYTLCGDRGSLFTSTDGTNWVPQATPTINLLSSVCSYSNTWIATGAKGTLLRGASNAIDWVAVNLATTNWIYKVRNVGGQLVAVGQNGVVFTSENGMAWTSRASGTKSWLTDVTFVNGKWVAVGSMGTMLSSSNLVNWELLPSPTIKGLYAATASAGKLVAFGVEGVILRNQAEPFASSVNFLGYDLSFSAEGSGQNAYTNAYEVFLLGGQPDQFFNLQYAGTLGSGSWIANGTLEIFDASGTLYIIRTRDLTNTLSQEYYRTENTQ